MPVVAKERWDSKEQYVEYLMHLAAYMVLAKEFIGNKSVLEIGCGTGYGADSLSGFASNIVGIDISMENISYCRSRYSKHNLSFLQADGLKLPFKASTFDVILSFQVIEHIEPKVVLNYLAEIKRVLKNSGIFLCSTPNKRLRLLPFQKPWNPEHKKEYNDNELKKLLSKIFEDVKIYGLCSSNEISSMEKKRVKQSPFKVYVISPFYKILKYILPFSVLLRVKRLVESFPIFKSRRDEPVPQEIFLSKISLDDFKINPNCPRDCLHLYGICTTLKAWIS